MATLIKTGTLGTEAPYLAYNLYAEQTAGSGNSRTVKITAEFKVNGSSNWYYGFPCSWRAIVNGVYGSYASIKGTESWNGGQSYRTYSQTITVDVGTTSSKAITVGLQSYDSTYGYWNGTATGSFTVGATNVAPTLSGTITTSPTGTFAENISSVALTCPDASDTNLSGYVFEVSNGGGYTQIYKGANRTYTHNIGSGDQGRSFTYRAKAYDSAGLESGYIYSSTITKNVFNGDSLSSSSSISYSSSSVVLNFSGASNTNGNPTFSRSLSCNEVTVYNATNVTSPLTITIYKTGTLPTGAYIKFDDLKTKFAGNDYKGTLNFTLTTANAFGSVKDSFASMSVNLQTTPNPVTSFAINENANSTAYLTVTSTSNKYFIPDGTKVIRVSWSGGSGKLGESVSYDLYVSYGGGSYSKVINLTQGTTYYDHKVPKQTAQTTIRYKLVVVTNYGTSDFTECVLKTLHYYNPPTLTTGTITRTSTGATVIVTVKSDSSIPNINTVGTWSTYVKGTSTNPIQSNVALLPQQTAQTLTLTGLTDDGQYDLNITYKDDTGFSSDKPQPISIGANSPIFFVNKYGAGVGGVKANSNVALNVKGSIGMTSPSGNYSGTLVKAYDGDVNGMGVAIGCGGALVIGSGESASAFMDSGAVPSKAVESTFITSDNAIDFYTNCNTIANKVQVGRMTTTGNLHISGEIYVNSDFGSVMSRVYHTGYKPTASDVGAMADGGTYGTVKLNNWIRTNGTTGWYSEAYGGGWHMTDTSWIRAYQGKGVYTAGSIYSNTAFLVGGNAVKISEGGSQSIRISNGNGYADLGSQNASYFHLTTDRPKFHFYKPLSIDGNVELYSAGTNFIAKNNYGYCGQDTTGSGKYMLYMDTANDVVLGYNAERYIKAYGHFVPMMSRTYWLGTNSPDRQWKGMCAEGGTIGASDGRVKENMVRLDGTPVLIDEEDNTTQEVAMFNTQGVFDKATPNDYYDFIKDRFKPTYYNYKLSDPQNNPVIDEDVQRRIDEEGYEPSPQITVEEEYKMLKNVGFIAQDYDLANDKVAQEFIFEGADGTLAYNHMSYVTVGMVALQEATKKIDALEQENKNLKTELEAIKNHLGLS